MIHDFRELLEAAKRSGLKTVSVAAADEGEPLKAIVEASAMGLVRSILVGNREWIEVMLEKLGASASDFEIIHEKDAVQAAGLASQAVREGRAHILMKGGVVTSKFLQAALGSPGNLKAGLFSDVSQHLPGFGGIRTCRHERGDRLAHVARTDRLQGARHLRDIFDAPDAEPHFTSGCHGFSLLRRVD